MHRVYIFIYLILLWIFIDSIKENNLHVVILSAHEELNFEVSEVFVSVDEKKRKLASIHHTATHLLNASLREKLGSHISQKGSYLDEHNLRFDFYHHEKVKEEQIIEIEKSVNAWVQKNVLVEIETMPKKNALEIATTAVFEDKYEQDVRVVSIGKKDQFSIELCGGTHVVQTGEVGIFKIINETSVGSGIRRIEAVASEKALEFFHSQIETLNEVKSFFKNPKDLIAVLKKNEEERKTLVESHKLLAQELEEVYFNQLINKYASHSFNENAILLDFFESLPSFDILKGISKRLLNAKKSQVVCLGYRKSNHEYQYFLSKSKDSKFHCNHFVQDRLSKKVKLTGGGNENQSIIIVSKLLNVSDLN